MPLRRFQKQYEQLSQFEIKRILGIMEAGWSARQAARQLGCSDCVVRRCCDQWIREMSFTRRPGSRRPRQTSCRKDRHIVRNACVQPTASSPAIQTKVVPSLGAPVSSQTIRRLLDEEHLGSLSPLRVLPLTPPHSASVWSGAAHEETGLQRNGIRWCLGTNPDSISVVMTIVFVCGDPWLTPQT
ncbi:transposable element Tcb2 transposase [Trichonephila clavipes]|nr:transposable element Tcb2 transposase [Trichonephila clavipes]